jgi:phasin family protein
LQVAATREFVEEGVKSAKSLTTAKDVQEALSLQSSAAKPGAAKAVAYSKSVYEVFAKANSEIKEIAEAHAAEVNKQVVSAIDTATQSAPAGSEPAVAFVKSAVSAATNAIDQFTKVSKQAADTAQANIAAAFAAIEKPVAHA